MTVGNQPRDNTLDLPADKLTVSISSKRFEHSVPRQAPISTINGQVSGGGTYLHKYHNEGFTIGVRNNDNGQRNYSFQLALFENPQERILKRQINVGVAALKPGYTGKADIELFEGENPDYLYLENITVTNPSGNQVGAYEPYCNMDDVACRDPELLRKFRQSQETKAKIIKTLVGLGVAAALLSGTICLIKNYAVPLGKKMGWGSGNKENARLQAYHSMHDGELPTKLYDFLSKANFQNMLQGQPKQSNLLLEGLPFVADIQYHQEYSELGSFPKGIIPQASDAGKISQPYTLTIKLGKVFHPYGPEPVIDYQFTIYILDAKATNGAPFNRKMYFFTSDNKYHYTAVPDVETFKELFLEAVGVDYKKKKNSTKKPMGILKNISPRDAFQKVAQGKADSMRNQNSRRSPSAKYASRVASFSRGCG